VVTVTWPFYRRGKDPRHPCDWRLVEPQIRSGHGDRWIPASAGNWMPVVQLIASLFVDWPIPVSSLGNISKYHSVHYRCFSKTSLNGDKFRFTKPLRQIWAPSRIPATTRISSFILENMGNHEHRHDGCTTWYNSLYEFKHFIIKTGNYHETSVRVCNICCPIGRLNRLVRLAKWIK